MEVRQTSVWRMVAEVQVSSLRRVEGEEGVSPLGDISGGM